VLGYDEVTKIATIQQRNYFKNDDEIEFFGPNSLVKQQLTKIYNEADEPITIANHPLMIVKIEVNEPVAKNFILRKKMM